MECFCLLLTDETFIAYQSQENADSHKANLSNFLWLLGTEICLIHSTNIY